MMERCGITRSGMRVVLLCAAAAVAFAAGCGKKGENGAVAKEEPEAVAVTVMPATARPVQRSVEVVGTLYGDEDVTISSKVVGRVAAIYKDVGDRVAPGEVLAQILKTDNERVLAQRQSAMQEVLARLGLKGMPPDDF